MIETTVYILPCADWHYKSDNLFPWCSTAWPVSESGRFPAHRQDSHAGVYHYADIFDDERYGLIGDNYSDYDTCVELADRLFWALNPSADSLEEWTRLEAGHDVRVYDTEDRCVYKAHEKLPGKNEGY